MEAILTLPCLLITYLLIAIILLHRSRKEKEYIVYISTDDPFKAWDEYYKRVTLNPKSERYQIVRIDGKFIVRKEI